MVKLDIITTRGGDAGETSLGDGARVRKDALRVEAYGTVDEANAAIGVLRLHTREDAVADAMLARIQNDLFDIGADLCVPGEAGARLRVADTQSARLEAELAEMNGQMPALKSFVLPGGTAGAAATVFSVHVSDALGLCEILNPVQAALPEVLGVQLRSAVRLVVCVARKFVGAIGAFSTTRSAPM